MFVIAFGVAFVLTWLFGYKDAVPENEAPAAGKSVEQAVDSSEEKIQKRIIQKVIRKMKTSYTAR